MTNLKYFYANCTLVGYNVLGIRTPRNYGFWSVVPFVWVDKRKTELSFSLAFFFFFFLGADSSPPRTRHMAAPRSSERVDDEAGGNRDSDKKKRLRWKRGRDCVSRQHALDSDMSEKEEDDFVFLGGHVFLRGDVETKWFECVWVSQPRMFFNKVRSSFFLRHVPDKSNVVSTGLFPGFNITRPCGEMWQGNILDGPGH